MNGRKQNRTFRSGLFKDPQSITIRAWGVLFFQLSGAFFEKLSILVKDFSPVVPIVIQRNSSTPMKKGERK
jgi:hypothetical protein